MIWEFGEFGEAKGEVFFWHCAGIGRHRIPFGKTHLCGKAKTPFPQPNFPPSTELPPENAFWRHFFFLEDEFPRARLEDRGLVANSQYLAPPKCGVKHCGVKMWCQCETPPWPISLSGNVSSKKVLSGRHKSATLNAGALIFGILERQQIGLLEGWSFRIILSRLDIEPPLLWCLTGWFLFKWRIFTW